MKYLPGGGGGELLAGDDEDIFDDVAGDAVLRIESAHDEVARYNRVGQNRKAQRLQIPGLTLCQPLLARPKRSSATFQFTTFHQAAM